MNQQQLGLVLFGDIDSPSQGALRRRGKIGRMDYPPNTNHRRQWR